MKKGCGLRVCMGDFLWCFLRKGNDSRNINIFSSCLRLMVVSVV